MFKHIVAAALSLALGLSTLTGCAVRAKATDIDLMAGIKPAAVNTDVDLGSSEAIADFAVSLFQNSASADKNSLVSPVSVLCALGMTANGAKEETLRQMEEVFGLSVPELNEYLHAYMESLPGEGKNKLALANSIWIRDGDRLSVEQDFLQTNADYYGAPVYKSAFDDAALKNINNWVKENTDGMIDSILESIPDDAVMYLINALSFDAEWQDIYNENDVRDGVFTAISGAERSVKMMYSEENRYLDDGSAAGFIKYYAGGEYAFAALLPNEGMSLSDYISSLTGEKLMNTIGNAQSVQVNAGMPKFESEYSAEMSDILKSMGMADAFDPYKADFSGIGSSGADNLFISSILHKTYIAVDEKGTKAGAATAVEMTLTSAPVDEPKSVILDRPFVYMIIDCNANLPLFIGAVTDIGV
jgi:serine protease inhibitor